MSSAFSWPLKPNKDILFSKMKNLKLCSFFKFGKNNCKHNQPLYIKEEHIIIKMELFLEYTVGLTFIIKLCNLAINR